MFEATLLDILTKHDGHFSGAYLLQRATDSDNVSRKIACKVEEIIRTI